MGTYRVELTHPHHTLYYRSNSHFVNTGVAFLSANCPIKLCQGAKRHLAISAYHNQTVPYKTQKFLCLRTFCKCHR